MTYRSEHVLAFTHTFPFFEHHIVIVSVKHIPSLTHIRLPEGQSLLLELNAGKKFKGSFPARFCV